MALITYADTNLPSVAEIQNRWCAGLPLIQANGQAFTTDDIQAYIDGAIAETERRLGIYLKPMVIMTNPWQTTSQSGFGSSTLQQGVDYDIAEPPYDYNAKQYMAWGFLQLRERPVKSISKLSLVLPNGMELVDFCQRPEWVKLYPENGQVNIVPYAGDPSLFMILGGSQVGFPFLTGQMNQNLPQMFYVTYTAGYDVGAVPHDIRNAVAMKASIPLLQVASKAMFGGYQNVSTSMDGLSESVSISDYKDLIDKYDEIYENLFDPAKGGARSSERGLTFTIL